MNQQPSWWIPPNEWSEDEWDNLARLASKLTQLLDNKQLDNKAWIAHLRITLKTIADYSPTHQENLREEWEHNKEQEMPRRGRRMNGCAPVSPITDNDFKVLTGRDPQYDDLDRVNCLLAGQIGHVQCGLCPCGSGLPTFACFDHAVPRLCYVDGNKAYFTTQPLADQNGDDWNDAPYEHNAGLPYLPEPNEAYQIIEVTFDDGLFWEPRFRGNWSVDEINAGIIAWLWTGNPTDSTVIHAGTSLVDFLTKVKAVGGTVTREDTK